LIPYDFVGRFENLAEDFSQILTRLGAPEETIALSTERQNDELVERVQGFGDCICPTRRRTIP
jgi:hypothetical protein